MKQSPLFKYLVRLVKCVIASAFMFLLTPRSWIESGAVYVIIGFLTLSSAIVTFKYILNSSVGAATRLICFLEGVGDHLRGESKGNSRGPRGYPGLAEKHLALAARNENHFEPIIFRLARMVTKVAIVRAELNYAKCLRNEVLLNRKKSSLKELWFTCGLIRDGRKINAEEKFKVLRQKYDFDSRVEEFLNQKAKQEHHLKSLIETGEYFGEPVYLVLKVRYRFKFRSRESYRYWGTKYFRRLFQIGRWSYELFEEHATIVDLPRSRNLNLYVPKMQTIVRSAGEPKFTYQTWSGRTETVDMDEINQGYEVLTKGDVIRGGEFFTPANSCLAQCSIIEEAQEELRKFSDERYLAILLAEVALIERQGQIADQKEAEKEEKKQIENAKRLEKERERRLAFYEKLKNLPSEDWIKTSEPHVHKLTQEWEPFGALGLANVRVVPYGNDLPPQRQSPMTGLWENTGPQVLPRRLVYLIGTHKESTWGHSPLDIDTATLRGTLSDDLVVFILGRSNDIIFVHNPVTNESWHHPKLRLSSQSRDAFHALQKYLERARDEALLGSQTDGWA